MQRSGGGGTAAVNPRMNNLVRGESRCPEKKKERKRNNK